MQTSLKDRKLEENRWQTLSKGLKREQEELQTHTNKLQTSLNGTQLEVNCWPTE